MKTISKIALILLLASTVILSACSRNYYSGTGKGSNCGCPSHKGMSGY